jgi:hypothetical protein
MQFSKWFLPSLGLTCLFRLTGALEYALGSKAGEHLPTGCPTVASLIFFVNNDRKEAIRQQIYLLLPLRYATFG